MRQAWAPRMLAAALCALLGALPWAAPTASTATNFPSTSDEVAFGDKIAKDIAKQYRFVTDPAQVDRLARVAATLTRVVERQDLTYHFTIIQTRVVNAFGIPGGWVYVTQGLMQFVRSDDELAAVLAHELTHINHRHYYIQEERQSQMTPGLALAIALSVLARSAAPMAVGMMVSTSVMANYQRDLEMDADLTGVSYLIRTPYSPVAMLTFMEHLAASERLTGRPGPSGLEDHPVPEERVAYIRDDLVRLHIPIFRRQAERYLAITRDPAAGPVGEPVTIKVDGQPILTIGAAQSGLPPGDRAHAMSVRLDAFFNRDPAPYEVRAVSLQGRWQIIGGEILLIELSPEDAAFARTSADTLAASVRERLTRVIAAAPYNRKF